MTKRFDSSIYNLFRKSFSSENGKWLESHSNQRKSRENMKCRRIEKSNNQSLTTKIFLRKKKLLSSLALSVKVCLF